MGLTSLLVCADAKTVQTVTRILSHIGMEVEHCGDPSIALTSFPEKHFDTVLVDCLYESAATKLISELRASEHNKQSVIIAILDGRSNPREVFAKGANFVLYKPVSDDRLNTSVAAAKTQIRSERRLTERIPVDANASIAYASTENETIRVVDLSVDGIAVHSAKPLPRNCKVYFQFSLPGEDSTIRLSCEVIWQNASGNVGMRFADVPKSSRKVLDYWIKNKVGKQLDVVQAAAPIAEPSSDFRQQLTVQLGLIAPSSPDRRQQPRFECSLGAEVARAGSTIQQRCMVTDLCMGGCYVQTSEPLPVGTAIEIGMRTQDLKFKIPAKVQSVHRGLGMGVHFISQSAPKELQQLISDVQKQHVHV
ncbi:MAG: PilZ domain-containing protein [Terriglobales bacterium]